MTERARPEAKPEMIIHGPAITPDKQLCKVVDSAGQMKEGILMRASEGILESLPKEALIMEGEHIPNSPVSIVTEAKKISLSGGKPALYNSRDYLDSWERTFGKNKLVS